MKHSYKRGALGIATLLAALLASVLAVSPLTAQVDESTLPPEENHFCAVEEDRNVGLRNRIRLAIDRPDGVFFPGYQAVDAIASINGGAPVSVFNEFGNIASLGSPFGGFAFPQPSNREASFDALGVLAQPGDEITDLRIIVEVEVNGTTITRTVACNDFTVADVFATSPGVQLVNASFAPIECSAIDENGRYPIDIIHSYDGDLFEHFAANRNAPNPFFVADEAVRPDVLFVQDLITSPFQQINVDFTVASSAGVPGGIDPADLGTYISRQVFDDTVGFVYGAIISDDRTDYSWDDTEVNTIIASLVDEALVGADDLVDGVTLEFRRDADLPDEDQEFPDFDDSLGFSINDFGYQLVDTFTRSRNLIGENSPTSWLFFDNQEPLISVPNISATGAGTATRGDLHIGLDLLRCDETPIDAEIEEATFTATNIMLTQGDVQIPASVDSVELTYEGGNAYGAVLDIDDDLFPGANQVLGGTVTADFVQTSNLVEDLAAAGFVATPFGSIGEITNVIEPETIVHESGSLDLVSSRTGEVVDPAHICNGELATIIGTDGPDVLRGTAGRDVIVGLGGDDVIRGRNGADLICAGDGNDRVFGNNGSDTIFGGSGNDDLRGNSNRDMIFGGEGDDRLAGFRGNDVLDGGQGIDSLLGGDGGNDLCRNGEDVRTTCENVETDPEQ